MPLGDPGGLSVLAVRGLKHLRVARLGMILCLTELAADTELLPHPRGLPGPRISGAGNHHFPVVPVTVVEEGGCRSVVLVN